MSTPRVVISANGSDAGKTLVTTALLWLLNKHGYRVQPFKVGPDYIDPGYHTIASGVPSRNLDSWIMNEETIKRSFIKSAAKADLAIIEGVRGLYEAESPLDEHGSTAHIAKILNAPVIIVLNCQSITRSAAANLLGLKAFDKNVQVAGVILNKVSDKRHEDKLRSAISYYANIPVLGVVYRDSSFAIPKRHLGLLTVQENAETLRVIESVGLMLEETFDLEGLLNIMKTAPPLEAPEEEKVPDNSGPNVTVGVFTDSAFTFYYADNIDALRQCGVNVHTINSLSDTNVGDDTSGLIIGGGYPEVFARQLEANSSLRKDVKDKSDNGMPIIGECGGLMYLCNSITTGGSKMRMAGVFNGEAVMRDKPQALSYVLLESTAANPIAEQGDRLKGHEFHYSAIQNLNETNFMFKVLRGKGINNSMDGLRYNETLGMYTHLLYLACPKTVRKFVNSCQSYRHR